MYPGVRTTVLGESWYIITQGIDFVVYGVLLRLRAIKWVLSFLVVKVNRKTKLVEIILVIRHGKAYQFLRRKLFLLGLK